MIRHKIKIISSDATKHASLEGEAVDKMPDKSKWITIKATIYFEYRGLSYFLRADKCGKISSKKEQYHVIEKTTGRAVMSFDTNEFNLIDRPFRDFLDRHIENNKYSVLLAEHSYARNLINTLIVNQWVK
jgi:hypothetical protein